MTDNRIKDLNIKETYDTKREQVDAAVRFVLQNNAAYYEALTNLPERVKAAILFATVHWSGQTGYHWQVLRAALTQFSYGTGMILETEPPFTEDELYS